VDGTRNIRNHLVFTDPDRASQRSSDREQGSEAATTSNSQRDSDSDGRNGSGDSVSIDLVSAMDAWLRTRDGGDLRRRLLELVLKLG
jgi:hypothetical protein